MPLFGDPIWAMHDGEPLRGTPFPIHLPDGKGPRLFAVDTSVDYRAPIYRWWFPDGTVESYQGDFGDNPWWIGSTMSSPIGYLTPDSEPLWLDSRGLITTLTGGNRGLITNGGHADPVLVDLHNDGTRHVIGGDFVYDPELNLVCRAEDRARDLAVADLDLDGRPEVLGLYHVITDSPWMRRNEIRVLDGCSTREVLAVLELEGAMDLLDAVFHKMTIADFTGDGYPEIFLSGGDFRYPHGLSLGGFLLDGSGRTLWTYWGPVSDTSRGRSQAPAIAVDFDGDGTYEVLLPGGEILDGPTGAVRTRLFELPETTNVLWAGPIVADLTGDGSLEVLFRVRRADRSIVTRVYGGEHGWAPGPSCWPWFAFDGTNINPDCSLPRDPEPGYLKHNLFRGAPSGGPKTTEAQDLAVRFVEVCEHECAADRVLVTVQVGNLGLRDIPQPVTLEVFGLLGEERELLAREHLPSLPAATWQAGFDFWLPTLRGFDDLEVIATPDTGTLLQCDEDNDRARLGRPPCPR